MGSEGIGCVERLAWINAGAVALDAVGFASPFAGLAEMFGYGGVEQAAAVTFGQTALHGHRCAVNDASMRLRPKSAQSCASSPQRDPLLDAVVLVVWVAASDHLVRAQDAAVTVEAHGETLMTARLRGG